MSQKVVGENLHRIRKAKGFSQEILAERAGLSRGAYRKIERAETEARVSSLRAICKILDISISELFTPVVILENVRFRANKKLKLRNQILADVGRWLQDFNSLEDLLEDRLKYQLKNILDEISEGEERPRMAAQKVRKVLGLTPSESIRDICGLMEKAGIKIYLPSIKSEDFFGLSVGEVDGGPAIVVNNWKRISVERRIFSMAHELGHLVLHLDDFDVNCTEENEVHEKEANKFAAEFLMPEQAFEREWVDASGLRWVDRVLKVKRIFHVSYKSVLHRISDFTPFNVWKRFNIEYKRKYRKSLTKKDEPEQISEEIFKIDREPEFLSEVDFLEDRLPRLIRLGLKQEKISLGRAAEIFGKSLSEMREFAASWVD